ncbi:MAG: fasciclin domain-containing protein [Rhodanobacter sp.]
MKINQRMRSLGIALGLALGTAAVIPVAFAGSMDSPASMEKTVMVGGAAMLPSRNIVQNAMNSKDHTTLVAAVKAAGLVDTLSSKGPFTVFAPTNEAFAALPAGTVETLLKPENKAMLSKILTYHVVPGKMTAHDLKQAAKAGGGKAMLKTVEGDSITVAQEGKAWTVTDDKGNVAHITIANVMQSNGVIFVIDKVLMP